MPMGRARASLPLLEFSSDASAVEAETHLVEDGSSKRHAGRNGRCPRHAALLVLSAIALRSGLVNAAEEAPDPERTTVVRDPVSATTAPPVVRRTQVRARTLEPRLEPSTKIAPSTAAENVTRARATSSENASTTIPSDGVAYGPPPAPSLAPTEPVPSASPPAEGARVPADSAPVASASPGGTNPAASVVARAPAAPSAPAAASAAGALPESLAGATAPVVDVKVSDVVVLRLKLADGGLLPQERARRATRAIEAVLVDGAMQSVRSEIRGDRALLFAGSRPIIELTREDAASMGEGSLELYATSAEAKIRDVIESEHRQSVIMKTMFNLVIAGALAYVVVVALRLLGSLGRKLQLYIRQNPEKIPAIRLHSIEVVRPHVLRSAVVIGIGAVRVFLQVAIVYTWLVFASSLFESTRGLAGKLTSLVLSPVADLMTRVATLLPLLLVTAIAVAVLYVVLRFVELFFDAVGRRETELGWLKPTLAAPTSLLIRIGVVVTSLLFLGPVVTGSAEGALPRLGLLFVVTAALSTIPLLANVAVGLVTLYGNRLSEGDWVEVCGNQEPRLRGQIKRLGLLDVTLSTEEGHEVSVGHLGMLYRPVIVEAKDRVQDESEAITRGQDVLVVEVKGEPNRVVEVLKRGFAEPSASVTVHLVAVHLDTSRVQMRTKTCGPDERQDFLMRVIRALVSESLPLVLAEWSRER